MRARLVPLAFCLALTSLGGCSRRDTATRAARPVEPPEASVPPSPPSPAVAACTRRDARLEALLARFPRRAPGALLGVDAPGCPPALLAAGADTSQPFRMASVAKTFVATLALRAVARGELSLDAPLDARRYALPAVRGTTLRALLQHTSGLFPYERDPTFLGWATPAPTPQPAPPTPRTPEDLIARALAHTPRARTGAPFRYANTNYVLLGRLLERALGTPLDALMRRELTGPLGLTHTAPETGREDLVPSYDSRGGELTRRHHPSWLYGAGDLVTTLADLVRWTRLYASGAAIPEGVRASWLTTVPTEDHDVRYGLGVFVTDGEAAGGLGPVRSHAGDVAGLHLEAVYFAALDAVVVAVVNQDGGDPEGLVVAAARTLHEP